MLQRNRNKVFGSVGESCAVKLLTDHGYKIIEKNFRSRFGEIDIVAMDGDTLVFVEVKARQNTKFGLPEEAVTPAKIRHIKKTADYYSLTHPNLPKKLRIDVVSLLFNGEAVERSKIIKVY